MQTDPTCVSCSQGWHASRGLRASARHSQAVLGGLERKVGAGRHSASAAAYYSKMGHFWLYGAAQESNLPSLGLPDLTDFEGLPSKVQLRTEAGFSPRFGPVRSSWVR